MEKMLQKFQKSLDAEGVPVNIDNSAVDEEDEAMNEDDMDEEEY